MRVVYATDLSEASHAAVRTQPCLECLQRIGVTEVHLVTVVAADMHYGMPGFDFAKTKKQLLQGQKKVFEDAGFDVETHVVRGTPHRRINGVAEAVHADMIIVGSRGQSPLRDRVIGSTARNIARTSVRPLLLQRITKDGEEYEVARKYLFRDIMFATDFSENANQAFEQVKRIRNATQKVTLLHILPRYELGEDADRARKEAKDKLQSHAETLEQWNIETKIIIREGEPITEILAVEEEVSPTLTVIGSRGKSRLRRLLLGGTSERIVGRAKGNVLLVPPQSR
ncbi:universal stress protein [Natronocalculus amylovorans]|uniref:Universal stress protein n=1 Tax=Natronocalculus amylovorans TaxID=2917812 RepID=A0AAE3FZ60_9EURY|nr:universal stress protein [Natronocalculus amylovorans]MCL9818047.1 universal stress protein [Natronocalculus amylovorans]NUE03959.1 universal stress protein [Halorubraceae archaeon YAN]